MTEVDEKAKKKKENMLKKNARIAMEENNTKNAKRKVKIKEKEI